MARKAASGSGSIRKKEIIRNGKKYVYWEARYSAGRSPSTGKLVSKSIYGKTQKEVSAKLKEITSEIDKGTYFEPQKMPLKDWLKEWKTNYLGSLKPLTVQQYEFQIEHHIIPSIGAVPLGKLTVTIIQKFYKSLEASLSPKSIKNVHGVLHKALEQAVRIDYIKNNPADFCVLPKVEKPDIMPLSPQEIARYLEAAKSDSYANLFTFALFSGCRQGEILGLSWSNIDFENNKVYVYQQLQSKDGQYFLSTPKNGKGRTIFPARIAMDALRNEKKKQEEFMRENADVWQNEWNLVFTNEAGQNLVRRTVDKHHHSILERAGLPSIRFHDLRHTFAVSSIQAGDDIKTIQSNLGHATASFTLDVYSHAIDQMKQNSADRLQQFYDNLSGLGKNLGKTDSQESE